MKLLAIETSTEMASVALLHHDELRFKEQASPKTHAQFILPMVDELMVEFGLQLNQLDGIVFGCGPGSFTGLRIACSIAKGLAFAHDLGLIPVSGLAAIAYAVRQEAQFSRSPVLAVIDARMQEMYWSCIAPDQCFGHEQVSAVDQIPDLAYPDLVLAGVGIDSYWADFPTQLKAQIRTQVTRSPHAKEMVRLAQQTALEPIAAEAAQPVYVRNQVTQGASRG